MSKKLTDQLREKIRKGEVTPEEVDVLIDKIDRRLTSVSKFKSLGKSWKARKNHRATSIIRYQSKHIAGLGRRQNKDYATIVELKKKVKVAEEALKECAKPPYKDSNLCSLLETLNAVAVTALKDIATVSRGGQ